MIAAHEIQLRDERETPSDGHTNMARDAELLARAEHGDGGCRVYGWHGAWISLGFNQDPQQDLLDPDLVPWVTRPTGGKAVLHGNDVTVGLALPLAIIPTPETPDPKPFTRSVRTVYRAIAKPLVEALNVCGLPAALAEETRFAGRGPRSADCFAHVSPNDIVHKERGIKLCGCALRLTSNAVLVQASVPKGPPLIDPQKLFAVPQTAAFVVWDDRHFANALDESLQAFMSRAACT